MAIKVYSTPTCPWCMKAKEYLKKHKITFTDIDVASDPKKAAEMIEKSGQRSVPVLDVNGNILIGYNEEELQKALKKK